MAWQLHWRRFTDHAVCFAFFLQVAAVAATAVVAMAAAVSITLSSSSSSKV
jgi:hypothetical protein